MYQNSLNWVDGEVLPPEIRDKFKNADLRTEFVPIYHITMPDLEWNSRYGNPPVLKASKLAECWDPEKLKKFLKPIVEGYERWIEKCEKEARIFTSDERKIARRNIMLHKKALARINRAIEILTRDEDSRLAFCFSNKAMDLQRRWRERTSRGRDEGLKWRPFQLAFILLNIPSIVEPRGEDREFCDLLWVPTGTGKTEAYLGIAAFVIAYRRRKAIRVGGKNNGGAGTSVITRYTLRLLTIQQFRRALRMITACEYLRVYGLPEGPIGWRPVGCSLKDNFLWGTSRFSIGLWVGGEMTPNFLLGTDIYRKGQVIRIPGAVDILTGCRSGRKGEPAQVINCPCCNTLISIPENLERGEYNINLIVSTEGKIRSIHKDLFPADPTIHIVSVKLIPIKSQGNRNYYTLSFNCLLYTSPSPRDLSTSRMPSSA